jgi:hypothetical protein
MLSITQIGWYHKVLIHPANRPVSAAPRLRNVETVTRSPPKRVSGATVLSSVRTCEVEPGGC